MQYKYYMNIELICLILYINKLETSFIKKDKKIWKNVTIKIKDYEVTKHALFEVEYEAFEHRFILVLKRKPVSKIIVRNVKKKYIVKIANVFTGQIKLKPNSYFHGKYEKGRLTGELDDEYTRYLIEPSDTPYAIDVSILSFDHSTWSFTSDSNAPMGARKDNPYRNRRSANLGTKYEHINPYIVCRLNIVLSRNYFDTVCLKSILLCTERILWYIHFSDRFYRRVDFDLDGKPDNIGFAMKSMEILKDDNKINQNLIALSILRNFSEIRHRKSCMNILFLNKWLFKGVLGLAYHPITETRSPGGICYSHMNADTNLNTMLLTERAIEGPLAKRHIAITMMHELGHSFGASHDQLKQCTNHRGFGNYVMYNSTEDLFNPSVVKFSKCSKEEILKVFAINGVCIQKTADYQFCGDFVTGRGEECDCGLNAINCEEFDKCCTPPVDKIATCRLNRAAGAICSPRNDVCCNYNCGIQLESVLCRTGDQCTHSTYCDTLSYRCPRPVSRSDGTPCASGSRVCVAGKCVGSLCKMYGRLDCYCNSTALELCFRCCKSSAGEQCKPIHLLQSIDTPIYLQESELCYGGEGFCDSNNKCQLFNGKFENAKSIFLGYIEFFQINFVTYFIYLNMVFSLLYSIKVSIYDKAIIMYYMSLIIT